MNVGGFEFDCTVKSYIDPESKQERFKLEFLRLNGLALPACLLLGPF